MYFEFLGHYTTWLLPLSIVGECYISHNQKLQCIYNPVDVPGILITIDVVIEAIVYGNYTEAIGTGYSIPLFCVFVSFWSQLMLEYWKRTEATKAMEWG